MKMQFDGLLIGDSIVIRVSKVEGKRVFVYVETPFDIQVIRPPKEQDTADRDFDGNTDEDKS